ncbi:hypothetical protein BD310DRAFT_940019, partial [Dichomitus squalens]
MRRPLVHRHIPCFPSLVYVYLIFTLPGLLDFSLCSLLSCTRNLATFTVTLEAGRNASLVDPVAEQ